MVAVGQGRVEAFVRLLRSWPVVAVAALEVAVMTVKRPVLRLGTGLAVAAFAAAGLAACSSAPPRQSQPRRRAGRDRTHREPDGRRAHPRQSGRAQRHHRAHHRHGRLRPGRAAAEGRHPRRASPPLSGRVQPGRDRRRRARPAVGPERGRRHHHPQRRRRLAARPGRGQPPGPTSTCGAGRCRASPSTRAPALISWPCRGRTAACRCRWSAGRATSSSACRPAFRPG